MANVLILSVVSILTFYLPHISAFDLTLDFGFLSGPLTFGVRGCRPALPTEIWNSRLGPDSAHCDLGFAVVVRKCPRKCGARSWGPTMPTKIWHPQSGSSRHLAPAVGVRQCQTDVWSSRLESGSAHSPWQEKRKTILI